MCDNLWHLQVPMPAYIPKYEWTTKCQALHVAGVKVKD